MASTYSPNLRLELIGTGEQQGTWGATTNTNLGTLLEEAIGGYASVTVSDSGDTTLTTSNGAADQSRNATIEFIGTLSATRNVICPAIEKLYVVKNSTSGGFAITFKVSGQTGVSIPNGATVFLYVDGSDARTITGSLGSQTASNVAITGGTATGLTNVESTNFNVGNASDTTITRVSAGVIAVEGNQVPSPGSVAQGDVLYYNGTNWARLAAGTANEVLTTNGSSANPSWTPAPSSASVTAYTSGSGNWTIPAGKTVAFVRAWGGGGSGGKSTSTSEAGAGGGGGACIERFYLLSSLGSSGSNVSYSVAAGGASVSSSISGNPGGNTTFSSGATLITAYGGGAGAKGSGAFGGAGGGAFGSGSALGGGDGGSGSLADTNGKNGAYPSGGGGGGGARVAPGVNSGSGGSSVSGGGGGGGAGYRTDSGGFWNYGGGGFSVSGGAGGGGGGGVGVAPAGGGGGAGAPQANSGAGGNGRIEIWVW
jgi:hypothetical protein